MGHCRTEEFLKGQPCVLHSYQAIGKEKDYLLFICLIKYVLGFMLYLKGFLPFLSIEILPFSTTGPINLAWSCELYYSKKKKKTSERLILFQRKTSNSTFNSTPVELSVWITFNYICLNLCVPPHFEMTPPDTWASEILHATKKTAQWSQMLKGLWMNACRWVICATVCELEEIIFLQTHLKFLSSCSTELCSSFHCERLIP